MRFPARSGELATASLLVSIGSGLVLAYHYEAADPLVSVVAMEAILPFGAFWRSLHFWSSQAFFLLLIVHAWYRLGDLAAYRARSGGRISWAVLAAGLPLTILALFTGYVLRWDATGRAAGHIAENLLAGIPIAGQALDRLFAAVSVDGVNRVYAAHLALAILLWGIGTWYHTRRVILKSDAWTGVFFPLVASSFLLSAPLDRFDPETAIIKGPWFFLGVQELLGFLPPLLAGVLIPAVPVALFTALPCARNPRPVLAALAAWILAYAVSTLVLWAR